MCAAWEVPVGCVLMALGGAALAVQAGTNAALSLHATKPSAAIISFGIGLVACCLYLLVDATALSKQLPSVAAMAAAPWWAWIGGVLGAFYVIVNITFAYRLGAGTAVAVFVCAQLGTSVVLDLTGLVGFEKRAFSWPRITGVSLMIMGVILITQFPGSVLEAQQQQQDQQQQHDTAAATAAAAGAGAAAGAAGKNGSAGEQEPKGEAGLQAASGGSLIPAAADPSSGSSNSSSSAGSGPLAGSTSSSSRALRGAAVQQRRALRSDIEIAVID